MTFVWIARAVLLALLVPFLGPLGALFASFTVSALGIALLLLALALLALGIVFALLLGVLGNLIDVAILLGLLGLLWYWPRGIRTQPGTKLRLAYRGVRNAISRQMRCITLLDFALCLAVVVMAIVLSLSSGVLHFVVTILIVLTLVGVIWKWPCGAHLPFARKLRMALRELWDDLRSRFRQ